MIKCLKCGLVIEPNPRQIVGCGCDPDSPTWVYIEPDGSIKGFSQAKWIHLDKNEAFQAWLDFGIAQGFCSDVWCWNHDFPIMENEETKAYIDSQDSEDPCIDCVSIYHIYDASKSRSDDE
jgi:hypothetical protein